MIYFTNSFFVDTYKWKKRKVTGYHAKGRRSHCAVDIGTSVLIFGGYNAIHKQHFGDLFMVNTGMSLYGEHRYGYNYSEHRSLWASIMTSIVLKIIRGFKRFIGSPLFSVAILPEFSSNAFSTLAVLSSSLAVLSYNRRACHRPHVVLGL